MRLLTKTRVQVTIEVEGGAPFDETFNIGDIYRMSKDNALQLVRNMTGSRPGIGPDFGKVRIVGEPKVLAVTTEMES